MIGDLLQLGEMSINYVTVVAIDYDYQISHKNVVDIAFLNSGVIQYNYSMKCLFPIPLTAAILENNGFERFGTDYVLRGQHFGLSNPSTPDNYKDNYWLKVSIQAVNIKYVHELQHALRLCGIKKEILL